MSNEGILRDRIFYGDGEFPKLSYLGREKEISQTRAGY